MSITPTPHGTHQVRWRDVQGRQRSRSFKTRALAERFERQVRGASPDPVETAVDPLWKRMLRANLGDRAAIEAGAINPNGHFVYLLWGTSDDRPLYVGRSSNILARLGNHMVNPDRRHRIARVTLVRCFTPTDAAEVEGRLIAIYQCELNAIDGDGRLITRESDMSPIGDDLTVTLEDHSDS